MRALQSGSHQNADALAEQCGVSRRTVFRDIESLREAGVPVQFDNGDQKYRIDEEHFLPPTNLTMEEALAVVLLAERAEATGAQPLLASVRDAAAKIEAGLPPAMQERLKVLSGSVTLGPETANPLSDKHDIYRTLVDASTAKRVVEIEYECLTEYENYQTKLRIYHLMFHQRSWYAIGYSSRHKEVRTFNLGRMLRAEPLESTYRVPRSFSIKKHLGNAWALIPETGPDRAVHLRFSSFVAKNVSEVMWHPTQRCEWMEDGTLDFYVTVSGLREIVWWVLGYGDQVEVVDPPRLRKMVAQRLRSAANLYGDGDDLDE